MNNISEEIREDIKVLGFKETKNLPKLKDMKKAYYDMAKALDPDKHMDEDEKVKKQYEEKFKVLTNAYRRVSIFILKNTNKSEDDEEENLIRKEFESMNVIIMNQNSVKLSIPKAHSSLWREVFEDKFGSPKDQSATSTGVEFKTQNGVSITLWEKKKAKESTILISGPKSQYLNFVDKDITKLFEEVLYKAANDKSSTSGRSRRSTTNRIIECNLCNFIGNKVRQKIHMQLAHPNGNEKDSVNHRNSKPHRMILPRKSKL